MRNSKDGLDTYIDCEYVMDRFATMRKAIIEFREISLPLTISM